MKLSKLQIIFMNFVFLIPLSYFLVIMNKKIDPSMPLMMLMTFLGFISLIINFYLIYEEREVIKAKLKAWF